MLKREYILIFTSCLLLCISCSKEVDQKPPVTSSCGDPELLTVYKIAFLGDTDTLFFHAATSDTSVIRKADEELSKPLEDRLKHINGLLSSGTCEYNSGYDWHFIPNEWDLVEASIEWCDAFPANPETTGLERVCPWASRVYKKNY